MDSFRIRRSHLGRGVYAARAFGRGEIVESCPVIVFRRRDVRGRMQAYRWDWGGHGMCAIPLGTMSLANHSNTPNVTSRRLYERERMVFHALRRIAPGEQILIDYGSPWFKVRAP